MIITVRAAAKFAAHNAVKFVSASVTSHMLDEYLDIDKDTIVSKLASGTVGFQMGEWTESLTDNTVDRVADWLIARKDQKDTDS